MDNQELDVEGGRAAVTSPREPTVEDRADPREFRFTLYICGGTEKSQRAVANARRLCDERLPGQYTLQVVDLYRQPELANPQDIFAIPTLVLDFPPPMRRFIGDLSENERLVVHMTQRNGIDR